MKLFRRSKSERVANDSLEAVAELLVEVLSERPGTDDSELGAALVARGVAHSTATRMVSFAPIAFGRVYLRELGVSPLSPVYQVHASVSGSSELLPLAGVPEFVAATAVAERAGKSVSGVRSLALHSAEVAAVENAVRYSSNPTDLELSPPQILWDHA